MRRSVSLACHFLVCAGFLAAAAAHAADSPKPESGSDVLARSPEITITRDDWQTELAHVPKENRAGYVSSPQRVQTSLRTLLVNKTLAARARAANLQDDPEVKRRIARQVDGVLATAYMERLEAEARASFDVEKATARARELYLSDPKKYVIPDQVDASHILFSTAERTPAEALAAANAAKQKLAQGADFATLAREISDDPSAKRNSGRLGFFPPGRMDRAFEEVAFAQKTPGEISEPVRSRFGYHLIKHEGLKAGRQRTFEEVKGEMIAALRDDAVLRTREHTIGAIKEDPKLEVDQAAIDALVVPITIPDSIARP